MARNTKQSANAQYTAKKVSLAKELQQILAKEGIGDVAIISGNKNLTKEDIEKARIILEYAEELLCSKNSSQNVRTNNNCCGDNRCDCCNLCKCNYDIEDEEEDYEDEDYEDEDYEDEDEDYEDYEDEDYEEEPFALTCGETAIKNSTSPKPTTNNSAQSKNAYEDFYKAFCKALMDTIEKK